MVVLSFIQEVNGPPSNPSTTEQRIKFIMTNINITLDDATLKAIAAEVANILGTAVADDAPAAPKTKAAAKKAAASKTKGKTKVEETEVEDEADEDDDDADAERRAELSKKRINTLRKMLKDAGFDADEVDAEEDKATLIQSIIDDENENADDEEDEDDADEAEDEDSDEDDEDEDEDEDDEDDEEGDEDDEYTRDDLEGMSLKELKGLAKDAGYKPADIKGLDQDGLVDFLLGEDDEEDEDDAEDEDEADEEWTEEELVAMSGKELLALAKEWEVKITPTLKKGATNKAGRKKIAQKMLASLDEE